MRFVQKLQHAFPSVILLTDGLGRLRRDPHGESLVLAIAELVVSVLVIGSLARAIRRMRSGEPPASHEAHPHAIDWIDICLAGMLIVEAVMHRFETGHLPRPTILLAATLLALGLLHGRLAAFGDRRRALRISDEGISVPGRFFQRLTLPWPEVAVLEVEDGHARIVAHDGRERRIDLADAVNADELREALAAAQARLIRT
jgi:hypothetical protein